MLDLAAARAEADLTLTLGLARRVAIVERVLKALMMDVDRGGSTWVTRVKGQNLCGFQRWETRSGSPYQLAASVTQHFRGRAVGMYR